MWNSFDKYKIQLIGNADPDDFKGGKSSKELKEKTNSILSKYLGVSVSKAKSEAIAFLLKNAEISIHKEDIFVSQINHTGVMWDFWSERTRKYTDLEISQKVRELEERDTIRAGMDFGHIAPDWQYLLHKGISGIIKDLEFTCGKNRENEAYYNERITVYNAIKDLFLRFSELSDTQNTEKSKFISENLKSLSENPPQTLAEAMQLIILIYILQTKIDTVIVRSLGGLDRMLYSFYKNDLESGRYTKEQLGEITKYFFWKISCMKVTANLPFYICGMDENGNDATNEFTFFLLEKYRELDIYYPKIHVMYHENIDKGILRLVLEMIREGKNSFVFMNTKLASKALEKIGVSPEDAKKVIPYGCYEPAAEGTEIPCTCGGIKQLGSVAAEELKKQGKIPAFATGEISAKSIAEAAKAGDETALEIYRKSGEYLGKTLAILIDLFNPDKIVIGSIFARSRELLWGEAERVIKEEALEFTYACCEVLPAELGENIGDYAAIATALI